MYVNNRNLIFEVPPMRASAWLITLYDSAYANAAAGSLVFLRADRASIWIARGWARLAEREEYKEAECQRQEARSRERILDGAKMTAKKEHKLRREFEGLWLTEETPCLA